LILGGLYLINPTQILAQETTTEILKAALKKQSKVEDARENLQKDEAKTEKLNEKYSKDLEKFLKRNSSGKLSPDDILMMTKAPEKQTKKIDKLDKDITKLREFLMEGIL